MRPDDTAPGDAATLRRQAEEALSSQPARSNGSLSYDEALALVHELQVHQIELELQNGELLRTRREAEALRDRYADLYDFAPVGYFTLDAVGAIREANLPGAVQLGVDRESLIGAGFATFLHPDSCPGFAAFCARVRRTGATESCDLLISGSPGHLPWYARLEGRAESSGDADDTRLRLVVSDVTARRRAEEELRKSEERFRGLVDDDLTGVFTSSPAGGILDCNPAFARMFGFASVEEARSASIIDTYDAPSERADLLDRLRREGRVENDERFRLRRDGTRFHVVENVVGDFDDAGQLVEIRGYISDDTQRYLAEAALEESERRHAFLLALGDRLRELAGVGEITAAASELVGRHLDVNGAVFCEIDATGELATVLADWTDGTTPGEAGSFRMDDSGISELYRRGLVRRSEDVAAVHDEEDVAAHRLLRIRASLGVPICRNGRLAAVFAVHSTRPRTWTDAEVELVEEAGGRIWDTVERARAVEALRLSEARHDLIAHVASLLLAVDEPQAVVDDLCRHALDVLDGDVFLNYFGDEASGRFVLNAYGGITADEAGRIRWLDCRAAVCGCVISDGCRAAGGAIPDTPDPAIALVAGFGVRAFACHPLVVAGETIGTLSFGARSRDRFSAEEIATMRTIADLIAIAMQRIADRDALRASEARLREAPSRRPANGTRSGTCSRSRVS